MQWLRRSFIAGFFVTVPLVVSVAALAWIFQVIDAFATPLAVQMFGRSVPGLGVAITVILVLMVGAIATNVFGKRVLQRTEYYLLRVPVFRTVYAPVKQLIVAFAPDNEAGFKRVVAIEDGRRGLVLGFLTREFTLDRGQGAEAMVAVYVPTNHLYLGDVHVVPREQALFPEISVEEGLRIFLTGGMALPGRVRGQADSGSRPGDFRV